MSKNLLAVSKAKVLRENEIAICEKFENVEIANLTADLFISLRAEDGIRWERARIEFDIMSNPNNEYSMGEYADIVGLSKSSISLECKAYEFITEYPDYVMPELTVDKAHELSKLGSDVVEFVNDNGGILNVLSVGGTKKLISLIKEWKNTIDSTESTETSEINTEVETIENETPCTEFEILGVKYRIPNNILAQYVVK